MIDFKEEEVKDWFDQYHQTIFKFIFLLTRDYQQSEDLTQETFLKAYKHYDSFNRNSSEKTWLFSIAHNLAVDYLRKQKPIRLIKELFQPQEDKRHLPENIVQQKESSREIYNALSTVKEAQREVIILRKIKGFSTRETAEILNCSEGKVKSTLHRGMLSLERKLKKQEDLYDQSN